MLETRAYQKVRNVIARMSTEKRAGSGGKAEATHIYPYMHAHAYIFIHIYTHLHTHTHTHTYTHIFTHIQPYQSN